MGLINYFERDLGFLRIVDEKRKNREGRKKSRIWIRWNFTKNGLNWTTKLWFTRRKYKFKITT